MTDLAVHILVDRSGSMSTIKDDAVGGLNDYVKGLSPNAKVWVTMFDSHSVDTIVHGSQAKDVGEITLEPRGMTPLYDAIGRVIPVLDAVEATNKVLVILTDGAENRSREWSRDGIRDILKEKQEKSNWLVQYLAANQEAFEESQRIGTVSHNTMSVAPGKLRSAFASSSSAAMRYAKSGNRDDATYTVAERTSAE